MSRTIWNILLSVAVGLSGGLAISCAVLVGSALAQTPDAAADVAPLFEDPLAKAAAQAAGLATAIGLFVSQLRRRWAWLRSKSDGAALATMAIVFGLAIAACVVGLGPAVPSKYALAGEVAGGIVAGLVAIGGVQFGRKAKGLRKTEPSP